MRVINDIIIHCSDSPDDLDIGAKEIREWHTNPKPNGNGWADIGYHYVVKLDGTIERGRLISRAGAHCYGHNAHSIGICYVGGRKGKTKGIDTRTKEQKASMLKLIYNLIQMYRCDVHSHHDYNPDKTCPNFDAHLEYTGLYEKIVGIKRK